MTDQKPFTLHRGHNIRGDESPGRLGSAGRDRAATKLDLDGSPRLPGAYSEPRQRLGHP